MDQQRMTKLHSPPHASDTQGYFSKSRETSRPSKLELSTRLEMRPVRKSAQSSSPLLKVYPAMSDRRSTVSSSAMPPAKYSAQLQENGTPGRAAAGATSFMVKGGKAYQRVDDTEDVLRTTGRGDGSARASQDSLNEDLELEELHKDIRRDNDQELGLSDADKRIRQQLGMPGAPGAEDTFDNDTLQRALQLGNREFMKNAIINGVLIGLWYFFSISISVYNKWMFSSDSRNLDFHFPLFTTSVHMVVQFLLASSVLLCIPRFRPSNAVAKDHSLNGNGETKPKGPIMTPWFYLTRIVSTGTVTGLDIGLGNTSLKFISLTFFTMCKSSTLGFVLLFAIIFRLESPSWRLAGIIAVMTVGVVMMVAGETAFDSVGFALLMSASACSGLRWSLTQILLRRTPATSNPFATLFFLTPVMFLVMIILAFPVEGLGNLIEGLHILADARGAAMGVGIILFPGILAFLMTTAEFTLLKRTSVVTLSVCGIFKEVLTIVAAGIIFGDELTPINITGLLITIAAIAFYNVVRVRKMKEKSMAKAQEAVEEGAPMLGANGSAMQSTHKDIELDEMKQVDRGRADGHFYANGDASHPSRPLGKRLEDME